MTDQPGRVWIDGHLLPADGPHVSVFDRGFQLGDGVFETLRACGGRPHELDGHLERLAWSASGLGIPVPREMSVVVGRAIVELLEAEGLARAEADAAIRITLTRGATKRRGLALPAGESIAPTLVVQAWPMDPGAAVAVERGLHVVLSAVRRDAQSPIAALKTTSRADYVYARLEAQRAGADDALFLTTDGYLSEATSANVFLIRQGGLATPGLDCAILAGTTRAWVLEWARAAGLNVEERHLDADDVGAADEAFLSSSVAGIVPMTRFAEAAIGSGRPGAWTVLARAARERQIRAGGG